MRTKVLLIFLLCHSLIFAQPILNESYSLGADGSIFSSILATDSCYYVSGMQVYEQGQDLQEGVFIRFNLDGTISDTSFYRNDTVEYIFWESPNLIKTLDGNFAKTFTVAPVNGHYHFGFIKLKPNGDTLIFKTYMDIYNQNQNDWVAQPGGFFQDPADSTYFGTVNIATYSNSVGGVALFKLDKNGNFLWHTKYYGDLSDFGIFQAQSLIKTAPNRLVIGGFRIKSAASHQNIRFNVKLILTDSLGNIFQTKIYPSDLLGIGCRGLTQTVDGGYIFAGRNGTFVDNGQAMEFQGRIVKLDSNFVEDWRIERGYPIDESLMNFENILKTSDSTFVAVGKSIDTVSNPLLWNTAGNLMKFNIDGEVIWERFYQNINYDSTMFNIPSHVLYSASMTPDSGFAMVGQVLGYDNTGAGTGQFGWLVKADKYGCLVPGCQQYDDLGINPSLVSTIGLKTYPNPANNELYIYYANQNHSNQVKGVLFNNMGQQIMQFSMPTNHTTYMMNVSTLNKGMYILKVYSEDSEQVEKIIIE